MTLEEFNIRFTSRKIIGGGLSEVFMAYDNLLGRYVAIKISKVDIANESKSLKEETELVQKLPNHDNIARYQKCYRFNIGGIEYDHAILEFYENGNLLKFNKERAPNPDQKLLILEKILEGIHFIHKNNIIHCDIKPENILIFHDKKEGKYIPKITDFGASIIVGIDEPSIKIATSFYSPPNQSKEGYNPDYHTDLWCFGLTALVFLGALSSSDIEALKQIQQGVLPPIDFLPEAWQNLIKECLKEDTKERIKNCGDALMIIADCCVDIKTEKPQKMNDEEGEDKPPPIKKNGNEEEKDKIPPIEKKSNRRIQIKYLFIFVFSVLLLGGSFSMLYQKNRKIQLKGFDCIHGYVTIANTDNIGIDSVLVFINGNNSIRTYTDKFGYYTINIPEKYQDTIQTIIIQKENYKSEEKTITKAEFLNRKDIDIKLRPQK